MANSLFGIACWLGFVLPSFSQPNESDAPFEFALIGDVPYNEFDATNSFPNLIAEINAATLAFVIHDGDIKAGAAPCTSAVFERCYEQFNTFKHPFIYIFGDNEWTDCRKTNAVGLDADAAITALREMFCQRNESLGQRRLKLARQSEQPAFTPFRENVRWSYGAVIFAGFNVPGDANNYGRREFKERHSANLAWLKESFALAAAEKRSALMLILQANPHFDLASTNRLRLGFNELLSVLEQETLAFQKPVVLVHGDSHYFRIDKPLIGSRSKRRLENFTRVETFGNPDVHWIRVTANPRDPGVFTFHPQIVKKNLIDHRK